MRFWMSKLSQVWKTEYRYSGTLCAWPNFLVGRSNLVSSTWLLSETGESVTQRPSARVKVEPPRGDTVDVSSLRPVTTPALEDVSQEDLSKPLVGALHPTDPIVAASNASVQNDFNGPPSRQSGATRRLNDSHDALNICGLGDFTSGPSVPLENDWFDTNLLDSFTPAPAVLPTAAFYNPAAPPPASLFTPAVTPSVSDFTTAAPFNADAASSAVFPSSEVRRPFPIHPKQPIQHPPHLHLTALEASPAAAVFSNAPVYSDVSGDEESLNCDPPTASISNFSKDTGDVENYANAPNLQTIRSVGMNDRLVLNVAAWKRGEALAATDRVATDNTAEKLLSREKKGKSGRKKKHKESRKRSLREDGEEKPKKEKKRKNDHSTTTTTSATQGQNFEHLFLPQQRYSHFANPSHSQNGGFHGDQPNTYITNNNSTVTNNIIINKPDFDENIFQNLLQNR